MEFKKRTLSLQGGVVTARRVGPYERFSWASIEGNNKELSIVVDTRSAFYTFLSRMDSLASFEHALSETTSMKRLTPVEFLPHPPRLL